MREGRLGYIVQTKRYGLLMGDLYVNQGFHCGQRMEVLEDGEWKEIVLISVLKINKNWIVETNENLSVGTLLYV